MATLLALGRHELDIIFDGMQYGIPNRMVLLCLRLMSV